MKKDWFFKDENSLCNVRVAGIALRDGHILL